MLLTEKKIERHFFNTPNYRVAFIPPAYFGKRLAIFNLEGPVGQCRVDLKLKHINNKSIP